MNHDSSPSFSSKHPPGSRLEARLTEQLQPYVKSGKITCAQAHGLAEAMEITPAELGQGLDLLEIRITRCQLGLFGYSPSKKIVSPSDPVPVKIREILSSWIEADGIPCAEAWRMAAENGLSRLEMAAHCEGLTIRIIACQLGAF